MSKQWYGCHCLGFLTCAQMLMHGTVHVIVPGFSVGHSANSAIPPHVVNSPANKHTPALVTHTQRIVMQRLRDQFIQEWQSRVAENSVCSNYRWFKNKCCFEEYLTSLPSILRQRVLKFRLSTRRLPIQQRRSLDIPRDERICTVYDSGEVGDEFHYVLNCSNENVKRNRTKYVDKYYTHHPNVPKFCSLMNMTSKLKNVKLAKFISCILELFWLSQ